VNALSDLTVEDLQLRLAAWGFKPSHAARVLRSFYAGAGQIAWTDLKVPGGLRECVEREYGSGRVPVAARQVADDGTTKLLLQLADGKTVEAVMMPDHRADRSAGCVSSQVGCAMACDFCATTQGGFERNLTAGEMVEQFLHLRQESQAVGRRLQTVVFMGMGEPLLNLANVLEAIRRMAGNGLGGLGGRQITVSTVGIVPGIEALAAARLGANLAISLHAPDDATRAQLLPAGRRFGVEEIMAAADRFQAANGDRPMSIQYCLLKGVNDSPEQARQLAALLEHRRMHVNLLNFNPTGTSLSGRAYAASSPEAAQAFLAELRSRRVVTHFRRPRGRDIDAACGQLRQRAAGDPAESS
jgi:23S rRNA (adenine2503-C2)-methyltransferase